MSAFVGGIFAGWFVLAASWIIYALIGVAINWWRNREFRDWPTREEWIALEVTSGAGEHATNYHYHLSSKAIRKLRHQYHKYTSRDD